MRLSKVHLLIFFAAVLVDQIITYGVVHFRPDWVNTNIQLVTRLPQGIGLLVALLMLVFLVASSNLGRSTKRLQIAFGLMGVGAFSNLISLLLYGHFIDYIHLPWWYTNPADISIVIGVVLFSFFRIL